MSIEAICAGLTCRPVTRAWSAATRRRSFQVFDLNLMIRGTVALGSDGPPAPGSPGPEFSEIGPCYTFPGRRAPGRGGIRSSICSTSEVLQRSMLRMSSKSSLKPMDFT